MTSGQPARDGLDAIDEAVAQISHAEVDKHLAKILRQGGFRRSRGEHTEPALRLDASPGSRGPARRTRLGWVAPLAAAAAVVLIVAGGVAASSWLARPGNGQPSHPGVLKQGASADAFAGVPPYYVEVPNQSSAVVRATATGATLARITTSTPFVGVTGAADDRTFVLDAQRQIMGPTVQWPGQPAFYLLRLSASGAEESLTRLAIAALPSGTAVTGLALSPDEQQARRRSGHGKKLPAGTARDQGLHTGHRRVPHLAHATGWPPRATRAGLPGRAWTVPNPSRGQRTPGRCRSTG